MKLLHTSDLHGAKEAYHALLGWKQPFDIWIDTGDFLPTAGRHKGIGGRIWAHAEEGYQARWLNFTDLAKRLTDWLDGRPAILVPGNHDFVSLHAALLRAGAEAHLITPQGVNVAGLIWAGFREVNWIDGEWVGEVHDMHELIEKTFSTSPDILVTHAPPAGILALDYGVVALTSALTWKPHKVKLHLFGHVHECGGQEREEMGIRFVNGAEHINLIEWP